MGGNGSKLSEMDKIFRNASGMDPDYQNPAMEPDYQKWTRNWSGFSEMGQEWTQITRNGTRLPEMDQEWIKNQKPVQIFRNGPCRHVFSSINSI